MSRMKTLQATMVLHQACDIGGYSDGHRKSIIAVFLQTQCRGYGGREDFCHLYSLFPFGFGDFPEGRFPADEVVSCILKKMEWVQHFHDKYKKTLMYACIQLRKAWDDFKLSLVLSLRRNPLYEYGTCRVHPARRNRKSGEVQFVLWEAGEQGHEVDFWHRMDPSHWYKFKHEKELRL